MHIALLRATISIPEARSLKDKRQVVRRTHPSPDARVGTFPSLSKGGAFPEGSLWDTE